MEFPKEPELIGNAEIVNVDTPELLKIYEEIIAEEFSKIGREKSDALSESNEIVRKSLLRVDGIFIGAGRINKIDDTYYLQRGCLRDQYRSQGYFNLFVKNAVEKIVSQK